MSTAAPPPISTPIAVLGIGCRLPGGGDDPDSFWAALLQGRDAVREVPSQRWDLRRWFDPDPQAPGKMTTRWGSFLTEVDRFDAGFFGVSPREAARMDPQQRLFLEVVHEALDHAGQPAERLAGRRVGVFAGVCASDYVLSQFTDPAALDAYVATGNAHSIVANRVSYLLDLHGPSMAIDTACSSSLVAVHLACQSLRAGEADLAIAGGVQLILSPFGTVTFSKAQMMAADGRCKTFDAAADGFVRGEGSAAVILKRLPDALADGDEVLAVILGSAVNQDGRSNGLMAPSGLMQQRVITDALAAARLAPHQIGYVETHGTGTSLGDPIEVEALAATVGARHPDAGACVLGALKSNLGHLEGAAGIAGLIKAVLAIERGIIPRNLHLVTLNPLIDLAGTRLVIAEDTTPWPAGHRRYAGVSSFGFGGTNAHVVLGEAPVPASPDRRGPDAPPRRELVLVSARTADALLEAARRLRSTVAATAPAIGDLAYTTTRRRALHARRVAIVAGTVRELTQRLDTIVDGRGHPDVATGIAPRSRSRDVAFVCSGQGAQWAGMAGELRATEPVFADAMKECDEAIARHCGLSVLAELDRAPGSTRLRLTTVAQPVVFALQVSLARLLQSWGVRPAAVVGHSVGEVAAAHLAGILDLDSAAAVLQQRSRLLEDAAAGGAMLAAELTLEEAGVILLDTEGAAGIAAVNGSRALVLAGTAAAIATIADRLRQEGRTHRLLDVGYAFHGPQLARCHDPLVASLADLRTAEARIPFYSTVSGRRHHGPLDGRYWADNLCGAVSFSAALESMMADEHLIFVELGPHPELSHHVEQALAGSRWTGTAIPTLRRNLDERSSLLRAVGALACAGAAVDFAALYPRGRQVSLPGYPWQRQRYWASEGFERQPRDTAGFAPPEPYHPILGDRLPLPSADVVFAASLPGIDFERTLGGRPVVPDTAMLDTLLAAQVARLPAGPWCVTDLEVEAPLLAPGASPVETRSVVSTRDGQLRLELHSREALPIDDAATVEEQRWVSCARGVLAGAQHSSEPAGRLDAARQRCGHTLDPDDYYDRLGRFGLAIGERDRTLVALLVGDGEAVGELDSAVTPGALTHRWACGPGALDGCVQALSALAHHHRPDARPTPLVRSVASCVLYRAPAGARAGCHVRLLPERDQVSGDITLFDDDGVIAELSGVVLRAVADDDAVRVRRAQLGPLLYEVNWHENALPSRPSPAPTAGWLLVGPPCELRSALRSRIGATGQACAVASPGTFRRLGEAEWTFDPAVDRDVEELLRSVVEGNPAMPWRVVHMLATTSEPRLEQCLGSALRFARVLARGAGRAQLRIVTRGGQAVARDDEVNPAAAALAGFSAAFALEHPELAGPVIDLPAGGPARDAVDEAARLAEELWHTTGEQRVAIRGSSRFVARLEPSPLGRSLPRPYRARPDASYLVTGGLGGLGLEIARWLVRRGARHLLLIGRSAPGAHARAAVTALQAAGATVEVRSVDVSAPGALAALLADVDHLLPPLRGVVHAAGVLDDGIVLQQEWPRFERVLAPKLTGASELDRAVRGVDLDFFVLFSSASATFGSPGQTNYAAANAALTAVVQSRRRRGEPAVAIDWGPWDEVGMAARAPRTNALDEASAIPPSVGTELFGRLLAIAEGHPVVLNADWSSAPIRLLAQRMPSFLATLVPELVSDRPVVQVDRAFLQRLLSLPFEQRADALAEYLRTSIVAVLGLDGSGDAELTTGFFDMGMDSLMALELKNRIEAGLGIQVEPAALFENPTIDMLARHLAADRAFGGAETTGTDTPTSSHRAPSPAAREEDLAAALAGLSDAEAQAALESLLRQGE